MILRGYQVRVQRWCLDRHGDPKALRWLKDQVFEATEHYYARHQRVVW